MKRKSLAFALAVALTIMALVATGCGGGGAKDTKSSDGAKSKFPEKTVTIVVPYGAGGGVDTAVRGIQPYLQKYLGASVLVENKPGSGSLIGTNYVGQAKPDGYTLLAGTNGTSLLSQLYTDSWKLGKPFHDAFIPIYSWVNQEGNGIYVKKDSPIKTMEDLAAEAKKRTIKIGIAGGLGSTDQVTAMSVRKAYGGQWTIVPADTSAEVTAGVLGGQLDVGCGGPSGSSMDPNQLRMLAVTMDKRSTRWPDTPTFGQLGKPQLTVHFVIGAMAPLNTPKEVISKLAESFDKARNDPEFIAWANKTNQPIGDSGWDAKKYYDFLKTYSDNMQVIIPDMQEEMRKAQQGK